MKLTKYAAMAAAVALMASCSDNGADTPTPDLSNGTAYLNLKITLPSSTGGRATDDAGTEDEYAVKDVKLVVFDATDNNRCIEVKDITSLTWGDKQDGEITKTSQKAEGVELKSVKKDGSYNALVVINSEYITLPTIGQTFAAWDVANTDDMYDKTGKKFFTMVNALGWVGSATATDPTVLVPFNNDNLYYTTGTSLSDKTPETVNIYVNRNVAKVSLNTTGSTVRINEEYTLSNTDYVVKLTAWDLDGVNTLSYPTQHFGTDKFGLGITDWTNLSSSDNTDRFTRGTTFTRMNWAEDPNYNINANLTFGTEPTVTAHSTLLYCLENTFDIANMMKHNSTRVVFKGSFYKSGEEPKSFIVANNKIYSISDIQSYIKTDQENTTVSFAKENEAKGFQGKLADLLTFSVETNKDTQLQEIMAEMYITANDDLDFYYHGECYYTQIIRHFEDSEMDEFNGLPADNGYIQGATATAEENKKYLGRYGVVRNNWYELTLRSIRGLGEPIIPTPNPTDPDPDDDPDAYKIDVQINILSWTKRSQGVDL